MSKPPVRIEIEGLRELDVKLRELEKELSGDIVRKSFREGAKIIKDRAQDLVPRSPTGERSEKTEPGNKRPLWKSLRISLPGKRFLGKKASNIYRVVAKHRLAWLAEYGSAPRKRKSGGSTGSMPASSFMRRAVDETGDAAVRAIVDMAKKLIEKAAIKIGKGK
jgi:hypothetical protein